MQRTVINKRYTSIELPGGGGTGSSRAMVEPVHVVPHDFRWPSLFALKRSRVEDVVGAWVGAVEHVGSTAVPELEAKPVINIMVGVRDVRGAGRYIRPLEELGYSYWAENPNPDRMLFVRFVDAGRN